MSDEAPKADPQQTHAAGEFKHEAPLLACRFDPAGQFVFAAAQDNAIVRWQLSDGKATILTGHESWPKALVFHPTSGTLYSGGYEGRVIAWNSTAEAPTAERTVDAHNGWVRRWRSAPTASCWPAGATTTW